MFKFTTQLGNSRCISSNVLLYLCKQVETKSHFFVSLLPLLVTFVVILHFHQNVNEFAFMTRTFLISNLNYHLVASKQVEQDGCKEA